MHEYAPKQGHFRNCDAQAPLHRHRHYKVEMGEETLKALPAVVSRPPVTLQFRREPPSCCWAFQALLVAPSTSYLHVRGPRLGKPGRIRHYTNQPHVLRCFL